MRGSLPTPRRGPAAPAPKGVLSGEREAVLLHLPEEVRRNMQRPGSESALVWDSFYPFAHTGLSRRAWFAVRPLWGTATPGESPDELLVPYFWGLRVDGAPLDGLPEAAHAIAGREDRLEIDLFLKGERTLIAVEAKTEAEPGRCGRFENGRCPEVHGGERPCRYWEEGARFSDSLAFGPRPRPEAEESPACARHYQLARTLLLAEQLGRALALEPHVCLLAPRRRWPALRPQWLDFAERVQDEGQWRRMRVLAWEDLAALTGGGRRGESNSHSRTPAG